MARSLGHAGPRRERLLSKPESGFGHLECPQLATVEDRHVLLAFHYYDQHRQFQGELSDPMPVAWKDGDLKALGAAGR